MDKNEFVITRDEAEKFLSQINAKEANTTDLLAALQSDLEELYIAIGEEKDTPESSR